MDDHRGLPMWKPETLLCYMAARPSRICWEDIKEWLWAVCEYLDLDLLVAELEGRPRAVWMKTGYLADVGERPDPAKRSPRWHRRGEGSLMCSDGRSAACRIRCGIARCGTQIRDRRPPPIARRWHPKLGFEPFEPPKTWGWD